MYLIYIGHSGSKTDDQPMDLTLKTSEFSAQLRNRYNSIGAAYHSEQGNPYPLIPSLILISRSLSPNPYPLIHIS
jgi:hypothetical protein